MTINVANSQKIFSILSNHYKRIFDVGINKLGKLALAEMEVKVKVIIGCVCTIFVYHIVNCAKGQLILKPIYDLLTSPKNERTNLICLLFYSSRQTNQIRPFVFFGESTARQSAF